MALSEIDIIKNIEKGASERMIIARKRAKKINMHVTGKRVTEFLKKIDDYENTAQKALREKLVKSNRSLFSFILRPTDKIFTAKGGVINYNIEHKRIEYLKESISDVADGIDIKKYLKKVVKKQYVIDPNGILFIDIDNDGMLETYIINSDKILWYNNKGNKIKGIIFEPYMLDENNNKIEVYTPFNIKDKTKESYFGSTQKSTDGKLYYRVMDEKNDMIYVNDGGKIYEQVEDRMNNYFGFVPGIILGDEKDPNEDLYESLISDVVEDADKMLRLVSVTNIHDLAHLYPRYWSYEQACNRCNGEGQIATVVDETADPHTFTYETCISCGGDGVKKRTSPSDEITIPFPQDGEPIVAPHLSGYTSPDLETAKFYQTYIEKDRNIMFQSVWGTTYEQGGKRETATGRWIDAAPVRDRLREISDTFSKLHKFLLDCYGKVILKDPKYESYVSYGDRYILENPDDLLKKYRETTSFNVSDLVVMDLRNQYFEAEYQNDPLELMKFKKLCKVEPFPSMTVAQVITMQFINDEEKKKKAYYSAWVSQLSNEQIFYMDEKQLKSDFESYLSKIEIVVEQEKEEGNLNTLNK